ncbi:M12 family metallopeptidase [Pseudomonas sp. D2002]|uniref:M12 family metallopeptidase n=1 Tax=Pseudomonas sp. D2002 TaxID=2726980 RepID=UPI0015A3C3A5|nr:M12 family metallopeptidase [Pseudomonas sp. D2002]NWA82293.1 peptidase M12 [Pseudomonas sp. D2002]
MLTIPATNLHTRSALTDPEINPPASVRHTRGIASTRYLWPQHSTITISLFDMPEKAKDYVKKNINLWQPYTNLKFKFIETNDGDIRISGKNDGTGSYSAVGTEAKEYPKDSPTMHIDLVQTADMLNHTIRHEFGHALGLEHEHQHPDHTINWDKDKVHEEGKKLGLSKAEVYKNIQDTLDPNLTTRSAYDPKSIMHYKTPAWVTTDGNEVPFTEDLSEEDKAFMMSIYPPEEPATA